MKFAKELDRELVPEWRAKYVDYKQGKKKLKAVARALRAVNQSPRTPRRSSFSLFNRTPNDSGTRNNGTLPYRDNAIDEDTLDLRKSIAHRHRQNENAAIKSASIIASDVRVPNGFNPERLPLRASAPQMRRYGSIVGSPPDNEGHEQTSQLEDSGTRLPLDGDLELPDPAMDPNSLTPMSTQRSVNTIRRTSFAMPEAAVGQNAFEVGKTRSPSARDRRARFSPKRLNSTPGPIAKRPLYKRMMSMGGKSPGSGTPADVPLEAYREVDFRQAEFFNFLDKELDKVEIFYEEKENQATQRLVLLREQLHIMRDYRLEEILQLQASRKKSSSRRSTDYVPITDENLRPVVDDSGNHLQAVRWMNPFKAAQRVNQSHYSRKNLQSLKELGTPRALRPQTQDDNRDYTKRMSFPKIPYRTAKRKLKVALHEYYRGLELLKSYALLNRTAFKKITKKYDKTVHARPTGRYMSEKVNKAYFVKSGVLEGHLQAVEDLYSRYFERGNHKSAVNKLRTKAHLMRDYTTSTFRNGFFIAAGLIFGGEGLAKGLELLSSPIAVTSDTASYLLQIYGGYFLVLLLVFLFCLVCRMWDRSKINYAFVFEFDTRHHLDWRQLSEFPSFFFFLACFVMWLNFNQIGGHHIFTYWPVLLLGLTMCILILPFPFLYYKTREWFLYSVWRLVFAGLYPVEFRDFFFGDMLCSLTYTMGNIALFFCLYKNEYNNPAQCNSSHLWAIGLMSCLPGGWRALQCVRRYADTKNVFPHLVNCGKYMATVAFYLTLCLYRLDKASTNKRIAFIFFATVNGIYTSIWDVIMDWSLGDWDAKHRLLRPVLGYKRIWMYYLAMIIDPILRFNWIFYAIFANDTQHSSILSYMVAVSEVLRRGMWTIFRVENEHCTNVIRFRASRDTALPYEIPTSASRDNARRARLDESIPSLPSAHSPTVDSRATGVDLEQARTADSTSSARRRRATNVEPSPTMRGLSRMGTMLRTAHAQDFERRRKPELGEAVANESDDDDDDDDDDEESDAECDAQESDAGAQPPAGPSRTVSDIEDEADVAEAQRLVERAGESSRRYKS